MRFVRRQLAFLVALGLLGFSVQLALGGKDKQDPNSARMDERKRAVHALNRLTFGPRPGDVERVMAMGVDKWIDLQLRPEKIDDAALESRLSPFRTLRMNTREIVENFPPEQVIKAIADGKQSLPSDPTKRAVYQAQLERYQEKQERKQEATNTDPNAMSKGGANMRDEDSTRRDERLSADQNAQGLLDLLFSFPIK